MRRGHHYDNCISDWSELSLISLIRNSGHLMCLLRPTQEAGVLIALDNRLLPDRGRLIGLFRKCEHSPDTAIAGCSSIDYPPRPFALQLAADHARRREPPGACFSLTTRTSFKDVKSSIDC
jgi:hypothetical protein